MDACDDPMLAPRDSTGSSDATAEGFDDPALLAQVGRCVCVECGGGRRMGRTVEMEE